MPDLLDQLTRALGPHVADVLRARTDLDAQAAPKAIPAVATPLLDGLRDTLGAPSENIGTLVQLYQFLTADDRPTAPENTNAASEEDALDLAASIMQGPLSGLVDYVASQLGVSPDTADTAVRVVVPKIFAVFRGTARNDGFDSLLRLVLNDEADAQVERILKLIRGADQAGSIARGLGGLFS
jgi:hypothetical protein